VASPAASPHHGLQPEPFLTGTRGAENVDAAPTAAARPGMRPAPGHAASEETAGETIETIVPVTLPRGAREIVLRIVIDQRD
jgi:hypothetical protein